MDLESSISALCASLAEVLHHADSSSSRDLAYAVSQLPIHLGKTVTASLPLPSNPCTLEVWYTYTRVQLSAALLQFILKFQNAKLHCFF
jgi:hypothetical protein